MQNKEPLNFYGFSRDELADILAERFGVPRYRAGQIFHWVYRQGCQDFEAMTTIRQSWRTDLAKLFVLPEAKTLEVVKDEGGTCKMLLEVRPGVIIETVLINQPRRLTLCISSQAGCGLGCAFCRTAQLGFHQNLETGDIIRQVRAAFTIRDDIHNVVFMGMGEPLQNLKAVVRAIRILTDDQAFGFGLRKVTVSTVGLVPAIRKLGAANLGVQLAVSLNATTDEVRSRLMPINRRFGIAELLAALRDYPLKPRRKITIGYVLIKGVNDSEADLKRLPKLLEGLQVKVNLIPFNEATELDFKRPTEDVIHRWQTRLNEVGIAATIRWSRGSEISAACGQLAGKQRYQKK